MIPATIRLRQNFPFFDLQRSSTINFSLFSSSKGRRLKRRFAKYHPLRSLVNSDLMNFC